MKAAQTRFYVAVLNHLWSLEQVPPPAELADWIESQAWKWTPTDLPQILARLKAWPPDRPYPPFPDDDALARGTRAADPRWWVPGARPGGAISALPRPLSPG